jgi:hypothetical protein
MFETNIVVIHDQIPHLSLPDPPFLRSRRHSRRHDVCLATPTSPRPLPLPLLLLSLKVFLLKWRDDLFFVLEEKMAFFEYSREKEEKRQTLASKQQTVSAFSSFARRPGTRGGSAKRCSFPFFLTRRPTTRRRRLRGGRESRDVGDCACAP